MSSSLDERFDPYASDDSSSYDRNSDADDDDDQHAFNQAANLQLGIIGPIDINADTCAENAATVAGQLRTAFSESCRRCDSWSLMIHQKQTLAISYRYAKDFEKSGCSMSTKDLIHTANHVCRYAHQKQLDKVYLWCDTVYSQNRDVLEYTEGGVAPYVWLTVISCESQDNPIGQYSRFWIAIETVLGRASQGVISESDYEGIRRNRFDIFVALAVALLRGLFDSCQLFEEKDRDDLKVWARSTTEQLCERLAWRPREICHDVRQDKYPWNKYKPMLTQFEEFLHGDHY